MRPHHAVIARLLRALLPPRFRPIGYLEHLAYSRTGGRVVGGPFKGMQYVQGSAGSAFIPKLLGIYERELHACVDSACNMDFPLIIDAGAAEGYYAVGMARRNPKARVLAFEMDDRARPLLENMAKLNGVEDRIDIRAKCERADLKSALAQATRALLICDVEGYEDVLLRPDEIPALRSAHLLVEMHDFVIPGITEDITQRFTPSHRITRIWQEPRRSDEFPFHTTATALLPRRYLDWAVSEWRPERMSWLWMEPRSDPDAS